jgi:hypothetical protein
VKRVFAFRSERSLMRSILVRPELLVAFHPIVYRLQLFGFNLYKRKGTRGRYETIRLCAALSGASNGRLGNGQAIDKFAYCT